MQRSIHGILLLDKPPNITSNGALQKIKRLFHAKKAGHTGSLDPIATGMLPICFGEATKFSQFLLESDKTYQVIGKLGIETTTGDTEGDIIETKSIEKITAAQIEQVLPDFVGEISQIPPMYSAIKFQGKPLYELARRGIEVERKPRRIHIFSLTLDQVYRDEFSFQVHCSKGTYIRTLVSDIGRKIGCGAHVVGLRRVMVAPYQHVEMHGLPVLENIAENNPQKLLDFLLPVETAVKSFPVVQLSMASIFYLRTGQAIRATIPFHSSLVRLVSEDEKFLGMGEVTSDGRIKPHRLVSHWGD